MKKSRKSREEWKIYKNVFDSFTLRTLYSLHSKHLLDDLISPVMIGKEANVFTASSKGKKIIAKIYRLESCNFNRMYDYIKQDIRFIGLKKQRRKIIFKWVEREFKNLTKASSVINAPKPIAFLNNVILMELIGKPALQLKDHLPRAKKKIFNSILSQISLLYNKANLVHGDLSEFNILIHKNKPFFIDFSQATTADSPNAKALLLRDLKNIARFFEKNNIQVPSVDDMLDTILKKRQKKQIIKNKQ